MEELFKDIPGYEGLYQVSNLGRVKSLGKYHNASRKINQYDLQGNFIRTWDCMTDIQRQLGIKCSSISSCCLGKKYRHTAGGFIWSFIF